jgi:beta-lactamase superfamily II metal-dependent hydrolase
MSGQSTSATYQELQAMAKEQEIDVQTPLIGTVADMGDGVVLTAVHCDQDGGGPIVLRVDYGATCFLLAGSAGRDVEQAMMARGERVRCEVLQVGRHGTDAASSVHFVETVCPSLAVISVGEENRTDAPDDVVLSRLLEHGATVARTDELGSIEAISDGQEYVVRVRK